MADEEDRARVGLQQLLEQLEGVDVEVVGRLVEHEHVGRQREQARQQQAVALAAGERAHRRVGARRREQEVAQVAHHVLALPPPISTHSLPGLIAVGQRRVEVERAAHLVEVRDLRLRAAAHASPTSGCSSPRISLSSVVLPAPFGPIRPTLSPRRIVAEKSLTISRFARRSARWTERSPARRRSCRSATPGVDLEPHAAERLAPRRALRAQRLQALRRGRRCACVAPRRPCGSRPPPAPAACRRARSRRASADELARLRAPRRRRSCPGSCAARRGRARRCASRRRRGRRGRA